MSRSSPKDEAANSGVISREIGTRIRARRVELGLTQTSLAEAIGVSQQQVNKYEAGIGRIPANRLITLCRTLRVEFAQLFGRFDVSSALSGGFAEDSVPFVTEPAADRDEEDLRRAFRQIKDKGKRKTVLDMVLALSDGAQPPPASRRRSRRKEPDA